MKRYVILLVALGVAGCARAGDSPPAGSAEPAGSSITPVSASNPGPDAQAALDACQITGSTGQDAPFGPQGLGVVTGMGLVPHARDVWLYSPLGEGNVELDTDAPAWVITTNASVVTMVDVMRNPTCVVVEGHRYWYDSGDHVVDGVVVTAEPRPSPQYVLPSLAP